MYFQDTFASMRDLYYKTGDGFLLVYSITDSSSLKDVEERYLSLLNLRVIMVHVLSSKRVEILIKRKSIELTTKLAIGHLPKSYYSSTTFNCDNLISDFVRVLIQCLAPQSLS